MRPEDVEVVELVRYNRWVNPRQWRCMYRVTEGKVKTLQGDLIVADDELGAIAALYKRLGVKDE